LGQVAGLQGQGELAGAFNPFDFINGQKSTQADDTRDKGQEP
jgi:hypothetical protein